ncbi:capsular biosynthesis protein [Helicobacter jaachi]|uniref:Capsular biosynthesis protein n=1 Tax=Helicobacter jaachi TaxID=1677920 RepID=A0A4U8TBD9_9HELI|nr:capsular biosynthesis protein [Helicobacter jaachi]TLD97209.1 capsular biosynthesis protein [Helicobacter jaachi]
MKKSILILAAANIATCPRAMRMVEILKDDYDVSVMGIDSDTAPMPKLEDLSKKYAHIKSFSYPVYKKRNLWREMRLWWHCLSKQWDKLSFIHNRMQILYHLQKYHYDVIICHDVLLLPVLFQGLAQSGRLGITKVIFDAREFYPWQNTSSLRWRILFQPFFTYLCASYAPRADIMLSVSPTFCALYRQHFGLRARLLMSLPYAYNLSPTPINAQKIKILYHGALNQNRDIHKLINLCKYLDERFYIDFIFTGGEAKFRQYIESSVQKLIIQGKHIRILPPVSLEEIIPFGNAYDVGLLYIPKHNKNLLATLPNKLFEYTQSCLSILMPPIKQIQHLAPHHCIIAQDFSIPALAHALNALNAQEIMQRKLNAHNAAQNLHIGANAQKVRDIVKTLT